MSNETFNQLWKESNYQVASQLDYENPQDPILIPKERDSASQHQTVLYVKYLQILKKLNAAYDQMLHPQKRRLLRETLISVVGRLLELKQIIVDLEATDYPNYDDILVDLKLMPEDMEIPIPNLASTEQLKEAAALKETMISLNAKKFAKDEVYQLVPELTLDEAVNIIQTNERGRQGRLRAKYMQDIRQQENREKGIDEEEEDEIDMDKAARQIQKIWKGYKCRKQFRELLTEEANFLGMSFEIRKPKNDPLKKAEKIRERRKVLQVQYEEEYQQALVNIKQKIKKIEGPDIKESFQDDFRQWYMEYKRVHGKFPEFPSEKLWQKPDFKFGQEEKPETEEQTEGEGKDSSGRAGTTDSKKTTGKGKGKDAKDTKKKGSQKEDGKKRGTSAKSSKKNEDEVEITYCDVSISKFIPQLKTNTETYGKEWQNKNEAQNFAQKHDGDIIKVEKRKEVEAEIKNEVFEILKDELKNLKMAVEKEKSKKGKKKGKGKGKGKGKKKGGKKGGKKGKKGKKEKDLTAGRTTESIVQELIEAGIMQVNEATPISHFLGNHNLLVSSTSNPIRLPTLAEIRRVLTEYCIMPLIMPPGNEVGFVKSVLLAGARGSGKTMLVSAIAHHVGATLFNISPKNTANTYTEKNGVAKMVNTVFKVAKLKAPSIVYINGAEMVMAKKVPKEDTTDPKRIKKEIMKYVKALRPSDKVIVIGATSKPWDGEVKQMNALYEKTIMIPKPDYGARYSLYWSFIHTMGGAISRKLDLSNLSRLSEGLSPSAIKYVCERVLTTRRLRLLSIKRYSKPLHIDEFVHILLELAAVPKGDEKLMKDWYDKLPMNKKRTVLLAPPEEDEEKRKAKNKKGSPKGGKKK